MIWLVGVATVAVLWVMDRLANPRLKGFDDGKES